MDEMKKMDKTILLFYVSCVILSGAALGRVDPETGRIRLLHIGDAFNRGGFAATFFFQDPRIVITPVQSEIAIIGEKQAQRYYRLYLPRTEECVRNKFDVICIAGAQQHHLKGGFLFWTRDAILENGVGFLMVDDPASFGGVSGPWGQDVSWGETVLGDILPVVCATDKKDWGSFRFKLDIEIPDHPLVKDIPWEDAWLAAHNRVYDKEGATVVARTSMNPRGRPVIAYMEAGEGLSLAFVHDWGGRGEWAFSHTGGVWEYAGQVFASMIYYPARVEIPDMVLDKTVREKFSTFYLKKTLLLSMIEFADRFNANTVPLLRDLGEAEEQKALADKFYIDMELEESSSRMDQAISRLDDMLGEAVEVRKRALAWIYLIEWFLVTGTGMVCGYVLWSLMIRRKLYAQVVTTRLRREGPLGR